MWGSSTFPGEVAEASLYQRPEKAEERADMVEAGLFVVVVQEEITGGEILYGIIGERCMTGRCQRRMNGRPAPMSEWDE